MASYMLDAHALIWMLEGNAKLGASARAAMSDPTAELLVPAIALAEACWAVRRGRTAIADWQVIVEAVRADARMRVVPLDAAAVERAMALPDTLEMHDAQIVAVTLNAVEREGRPVRLLTRDGPITASGLVATLW